LHLFIQKWIPGTKVPDRRKLSGEILDAAAERVVENTRAQVKGKLATGSSDGWKNVAKDDVITSFMNVNRQAHLVKTHDMAGKAKTGNEHYEIIRSDIRHMETTYNVKTIAWVTDDGPDGKRARLLLQQSQPSIITSLCWGHQSNLLVGDYFVLPEYMVTVSRALEVIKWFNNHRSALDLFNTEQLTTYKNITRPLVLTLPVITRWTAHFHSICWLLSLSLAMKACVLKHREELLRVGPHGSCALAK
ncbi:hypothetical protein C8Q74DRAFT_1167205, partial [Fomes fomentarius]